MLTIRHHYTISSSSRSSSSSNSNTSNRNSLEPNKELLTLLLLARLLSEPTHLPSIENLPTAETTPLAAFRNPTIAPSTGY